MYDIGVIRRTNMIVNESKQKFLKLTNGDTDFMMTDGIKLVPRATIEISLMCPSNLMIQIQDAMAKGYIKAVAYVREESYMWEQLKK